MDTNIRLARTWELDEHLQHINEGEWIPMLDPNGVPFEGIAGKQGVQGLKSDGTHIGCDFVRMQPGAVFPLHTHEGDHEIYFIAGSGFVHINGVDVAVTAGHLIHIPAEYPHGIWVAKDAACPLVCAAMGHPHKHVDAHDRMQAVEDDHGTAIPGKSAAG